MNELGTSKAVPEVGDENSASEVARPRRPYTAPAIVEFGSVKEFTRGTGSSPTLDSNRTTRVRAR